MNNTERTDILNRLGEAVSRFNKEVSEILKPITETKSGEAPAEVKPSGKRRGRPPKQLTYAEKMAVLDGRKPKGWSSAKYRKVREREMANLEAEMATMRRNPVKPARLSAEEVRKSMGWD